MKKSLLLPVLVLLTGVVFISRLFVLQILNNNDKDNLLGGSTVKKIYTYPERGFIFDRNNQLLVANKSSYDVKIIPKEVKPFDTLEFCKLLNIDKTYFDKRFKKAVKYSRWLPSVFLNHLSKEDYAYLQEKIHKYKGFTIQKKTLRHYPHTSAANVLGYINEVSEDKAKDNPNYEQGELIGTTGIERQYEQLLRGTKGVAYKLRNRFNKITDSYKEGIYDTLPISGKDLTLTLDLELQKFGEKLMANKRGGIVAIEPRTGEILSLITAPSYNPNDMVGRKRSKNSVRFFNDSINKPMFDRGLLASYAPGSPFKLIQGLIGLQEEVVTPKTGFYCHHGYRYGTHKDAFMGCHCGITGRPIQMELGIAKSCNSYFSNVYKRLIEKYPTPQEGVDRWAAHLKSFGLGNFLGYDLPIGQRGLIPNSKLYDAWYPSKQWKVSYIISNAIGQGQIETTPIQLANMTAAIANRGYYIKPHFLKKVDNTPIKETKYLEKHKTTIAKKHFVPVIEGMHDVFKSGTAQHVRLKDIEICGKTGTVQNYIIKNGEKHELADHSIFVAFAPKHNPKIALAIFVENGGYGSTIAAPIASLMIEKYLKGETSLKFWENRILNTSLQEEYDKATQILQQEDIEKTEK